MTTTQVSIRLGVDGKVEVKRAFEEVSQAGQAAFGQVEKALDKTGAATDRETARFKRMADAARMAAQAEASQANFNRVLGVDRAPSSLAGASARVFEEAAREAAEFEARAKSLRAELDPVGAAQGKLNRELAEYQALADRGRITTAELAAGQALARQRFEATEKAIRGVGGATGLTRNQLLTLQYTFNDVVAQIATGGVSPLTILMQQGGQVTQAFGGLRGTMVTLGSAIGVVGGIIAGVAGVVGVLTAAWLANDTSTRAVTTALAGLGRSSGATADQLERVAQSSAEAGKVSVSSAREMQVAFLRAGRIGADEIGRAIALSRDLGATLGVETKEGAELLAKALADPAKGVDELNERVRFLDDKTRAYVRTLAEQNQRGDAQRAILAALKPALADAEQATNAFGRAWQFVARSASNAFDALGSGVDRAVSGRTPEQERELLAWQRDRLRENAARSGSEPAMLADVERRLAAIDLRLDAQRRKAAALAADARANDASIKAGDTARDLVPGARDIQRLREQEAALRNALADPEARAKLADTGQVEQAYQRVRSELARYRDGLGTAATAAERFRGSASVAAAALVAQDDATEVAIRSTLELAGAWLESAEAAQRAEARRQGLADQAREGIDAETRARQALRERVAEQAVEGARQAADLGRQAEAQRRVNDAMAGGAVNAKRAQEALERENALRPLVVAQATAEGEARERLGRIIDRTREAYEQLHREQTRAEALRGIEGRRDEIELREREFGLIRRGAAARQDGVAALRIEQELRRANVDLAGSEAGVSREQVRRLNELGRSIAGRETAFDYEAGNRGLAREIDLLKQGASARSAAIALIRVEQALRQRGIEPSGAEGQAALVAARRQIGLERQADALVAVQDQRSEVDLISKQIELIGASATQREQILATVRAENELRRRGIELASEEGQAYVANALRIQQLTAELQKQEGAQRALQGAIGNALDRFGSLLSQGKTDWNSWADAGRSALSDITNELIKLAVLNPLKNFLFGSNQPTLQNAGGLLGSLFSGGGLGNLFGGGAGGSLYATTSAAAIRFHSGGLVGRDGVPVAMNAAVFANAPRLHSGGFLRPDEVPAILQTGERVLNRREAAEYRDGATRPAPMIVSFNVTTPDAGSFRRAQAQITADMASALERARRNL